MSATAESEHARSPRASPELPADRPGPDVQRDRERQAAALSTRRVAGRAARRARAVRGRLDRRHGHADPGSRADARDRGRRAAPRTAERRSRRRRRRGAAAAETPWCVVMDADLQHPPELAPALVAEGERTGAQLVVGSRYRAGHQAAGFTGPIRSLISRLCTRLVGRLPAHAGRHHRPDERVVRDPPRPVGIRRAAAGGLQDPAGAGGAHPAERVAELPYGFRPRHSGESKAGYAEGMRFLRHLTTLRLSGPRGRMFGFLLIGASGVLPNLLATWLLVRLGVHYLLAAILANQVALLWNFLLIDFVLFHHRRSGIGPGGWPASRCSPTPTWSGASRCSRCWCAAPIRTGLGDGGDAARGLRGPLRDHRPRALPLRLRRRQASSRLHGTVSRLVRALLLGGTPLRHLPSRSATAALLGLTAASPANASST